MTSDESEQHEGDEDPSAPESIRPSHNGPGPEMGRLPPPAFPPGSRRSSAQRARIEAADEGAEGEVDDESDLPNEAFISPDEPIRKEARGIPDDAFISPDDPFLPAEETEEGEVTPMGEQLGARTPTATKRRSDVPSIHELPYLLDRLAEQINESGRHALDVHGDMGRFEAALKSFLQGYLRGSGD